MPKGMYLTIFLFALLIIHFIFITTNVYGNCQDTKIKECSICIDNGNEYPCNCKYKQECGYNFAMFIVPTFMLVIIIISTIIRD
ncbi:MAG: hypothetical protein AABY22_23570 [Nanoarchaeota archaeon]